AFNLAAPRLHAYYSTVLDGICSKFSKLERFRRRSVFSCCCFNLGPRVRAFIHTDHLNAPFVWCAITALGHSPGSSVFIFSALVRHSNISVSLNETWFAIVQWMPGAMCRWFREEHGKNDMDAANQARWREG
ncbi:hypothetical protein GLOTRDRAFT_50370, partial [Gloeophyllum trabeum ATCC 11539]